MKWYRRGQGIFGTALTQSHISAPEMAPVFLRRIIAHFQSQDGRMAKLLVLGLDLRLIIPDTGTA